MRLLRPSQLKGHGQATEAAPPLAHQLRSGSVHTERTDQMERDEWPHLIRELGHATYQFGVIESGSPVYRVEFDAGLTDEEVQACEHRFGFRFPPDLRQFLQTALPRSLK